MAAEMFSFDRHFYTLMKKQSIVCCNCEIVQEFTLSGYKQHVNSKHPRMNFNDLTALSKSKTKELVVEETRRMLSALSDFVKVSRKLEAKQ